MAGEVRRYTLVYNVVDIELLPDDMDAGDVSESLGAALDAAADAWYREHPNWLACEPMS